MNLRSLAIWGAIILVLVAVFGILNRGGQGGPSPRRSAIRNC